MKTTVQDIVAAYQHKVQEGLKISRFSLEKAAVFYSVRELNKIAFELRQFNFRILSFDPHAGGTKITIERVFTDMNAAPKRDR